MTINSRQKGARGEREFAEFLRSHGLEARRGQQFSGGTDSPDVIVNIPAHFEVKRVESLSIYKALEQAERDCPDENKCKIVAHKKNNKKWIAILDMSTCLELLKTYFKRRL